MYKQFGDNMPKHNNNEMHEYTYKAICLIYAYVNNAPITSESLKKDIKDIIVIAPKLITVIKIK